MYRVFVDRDGRQKRGFFFFFVSFHRAITFAHVRLEFSNFPPYYHLCDLHLQPPIFIEPRVEIGRVQKPSRSRKSTPFARPGNSLGFRTACGLLEIYTVPFGKKGLNCRAPIPPSETERLPSKRDWTKRDFPILKNPVDGAIGVTE